MMLEYNLDGALNLQFCFFVDTNLGSLEQFVFSLIHHI